MLSDHSCSRRVKANVRSSCTNEFNPGSRPCLVRLNGTPLRLPLRLVLASGVQRTMSKSTAGDSRPPLLSSGSGSSNASATQTTIRLVSTSTNPSSRGSSPPPLDGDYREHLGGSPTSSYSSVDSSTAEDWRRWMRAYTAGSWRGDVAPYPPPPISAVLKAAGELRDPLSSSPRLPVHSLPPPAPNSSNEPSPADFTIYPESASSRSSNGSSVDNPDVNDVMDHFQKKRFLKGPKSPYEQERLRSMKRYNLDDPNRRASIDRVCALRLLVSLS